MPFQPFDIVMLRAEAGNGVYAILRPDPLSADESYVMVKLDKGPFVKTYRIRAASVLARIGTLDPEALKLNPAQQAAPEGDWQQGQRYARFMAQEARQPEDRLRWGVLADLKPGDPVLLHVASRRGCRPEVHRFIEVLPNGQKYVFSAVNTKGTIYRYPLSTVAVRVGPIVSAGAPPAPPPRTEQLSPPPGGGAPAS